jgi:hypothetical protein
MMLGVSKIAHISAVILQTLNTLLLQELDHG